MAGDMEVMFDMSKKEQARTEPLVEERLSECGAHAQAPDQLGVVAVKRGILDVSLARATQAATIRSCTGESSKITRRAI